MVRNIDPEDPVPAPNARGEVVLLETAGNYLGEVLVAFFTAAPVLFSALYWGEDLAHGSVPALTNAHFILAAKLGFLLLPAFFLVLGDVIMPPRLSITARGIALRRRGFTKVLRWADVIEIKLQLVTTAQPRGGTISKTVCHIIGRNWHLLFGPVFGVNPRALGRYLQTRGQTETGASIALSQTSGVVENSSSPVIMLLLVAIVLGCGSLFLWIYILLGVGTLETNQATLAPWISAHFSSGN